MPNPTTISHLLELAIGALVKYSIPPGHPVATAKHPNGVPVQAKAAPLVADLEASRKASGFMSHAATMFCSFCLCESSQIESLDVNAWIRRDAMTVQAQAQAWLETTTKAGREALEQHSGVRWTPLYQLPYWDPVRHIVLGYMHNWLEGILQHHLRTLWGIGQDVKGKEREKELEKEEQWTESDVSDSADKLEDLLRESAAHDNEAAIVLGLPPSHLPSLSSHLPSATLASPAQPFSPPSSESSESSSDTPTASEIHSHTEDPNGNEDENGSEDLDYVPPNASTFNFDDSELLVIRGCIANTTLPTWVQRPPKNLGEASHGKLKAQDYLTLFTCIFPLIIPEIWHTPTSREIHHRHLDCFYQLVSATNIISSFKTSNSQADAYMQHYIQYRSAIQTLFPDEPSKPNHHFGMHNGDLLKYWGPLPSFSEFPGERMNGMLQRIKTNGRLSMSLSFPPSFFLKKKKKRKSTAC